MATVFNRIKDILMQHGVQPGMESDITFERYAELTRQILRDTGEAAHAFVLDCFMPTGEPIDPGFEDSLSHYCFNPESWDTLREEWLAGLSTAPNEPWDELNGARAEHSESGKAIFIALPKHLWRPAGVCSCPYCTEDPNLPGQCFWDTLAVSVTNNSLGQNHAWTVHRPEMHGAKPKRAIDT